MLATEPQLEGAVVAAGFELVEWFGWGKTEVGREVDEGGANLGGRYAIVPRDEDYVALDRGGPNDRGLFTGHRGLARDGARGWGGSKQQWVGKFATGFREAVRRSGVDIYTGSL